MIAAIYSRKSRLSEKGESIQNQIELCREYAKKLQITKFMIYTDDGFSGKNTKRPGFMKLLQDAKDNKFAYLICYRLDRISRSVLDFSNTIEILNKNNIKFISIKEQFDTSTPMGRAMMNIAAVFAQLERETISERIKDNMMELAKTGRWLGGITPLGFKSEPVYYANDSDKTKKMYKLVPVPDEIKIVKLIFKLYLSNHSFSHTAYCLSKNHLKGKKGGNFSKNIIRQIITNPVYCTADSKVLDFFSSNRAIICHNPDSRHGIMAYNKKKKGQKMNPLNKWIISVGMHKGVIKSSDWLKCQHYRPAVTSPQKFRVKKFMLSGLLLCSNCGRKMVSWSHYNKKRDVYERYYRCSQVKSGCKMLNAYKAEDCILNSLSNVPSKTLLNMYNKYISNTENKIFKNILKDNLSKRYDKNSKVISGLIQKIAVLPDEDIKLFKSEIDKLKLQNRNIEIELEEIKKEKGYDIKDLSEKIIQSLETSKSFFDLIEDTNIKSQILFSIIDNIKWNKSSNTLEINFKQ